LAGLSEEELTILSRKKGVVQRIQEVDYKQHWLNFMIFLEKLLRRLKIIFLKIENLLSKWIRGLSNQSQIMTQKSKEWIKQKEMKRRIPKNELTPKPESEISIKIDKIEGEKEIIPEPEFESEEDEDQLSLDDLKKPIKEEQKWINLIIENPKNITAYKFLGFLYWKQHNYVDAKSSLEMAVKLGSKDNKVKKVLEEIKNMKIK
jgi:tetratricopeptide (TPR) repeat protein